MHPLDEDDNFDNGDLMHVNDDVGDDNSSVLLPLMMRKI